MKLSLAANYDAALIPRLKEYPVEEVFGKFPSDFAGGGRPSYMGTPLSSSDLARYVKGLRAGGIAFNYLLNSACQGNREWTGGWQRKLRRFLGRLRDMGVARITVSTPFLLERVKALWPDVHVKVGLYAQIDTPRRARFWESLGADTLTVDCRSINRNFGRLKAIREAVRCDLQLIANHVCLPNCPMLAYHENGIAHASNGSRGLFVDYCFLRCSRLRLADPSLLVKAGWIRPEDTAAYEAIGYSTFKILERGMPSAALMERVEAYSRRRFDGNLADLLLPYGFRQAPRKGRLWALRHFLKPLQASLRSAGPFFALMKEHGLLYASPKPLFTVESSRIPPDFLEGFRRRDCTMLDCRACGYCEAIAAEAVRVDPARRDRLLGLFGRIESSMVQGGLWGA